MGNIRVGSQRHHDDKGRLRRVQPQYKDQNKIRSLHAEQEGRHGPQGDHRWPLQIVALERQHKPSAK